MNRLKEVVSPIAGLNLLRSFRCRGVFPDSAQIGRQVSDASCQREGSSQLGR